LFLLLLVGMAIGQFIGHYMEAYPQFAILKNHISFGMTSPTTLYLGIITLVLGITIDINPAAILGMILGWLVFRQMVR